MGAVDATLPRPGERFACFRKKPVVIQALRITVPMTVTTLEGAMRGEPGDWLIIGVKGERYFCKDDIFRATYESEYVDGDAMLAGKDPDEAVRKHLADKRFDEEYS